MKKTAAALLSISFILLLSGCSFRIQQIDSLMRPPMVQGDYHKLQETFYKSVGKDIILKSPQNGKYRSAFIRFDIDNDSEDEVMAFYIKIDDKTTARMNVLDKSAGKWYSAGDFTGFGSEIDSVAFTDMNNDLLTEILISWRLYDSNENRYLTIYNCVNNSPVIDVKALSTELYTLMEPLDIDNDLEKEVFIVYLDMTAEIQEAYAKTLKMLDNGLIELASQIKLDSNIIGYTDIKTDKPVDGYPMRIYIDANKGETQMVTEMVYWDSDKKTLVSPLLNIQTQSNTLTLRNNSIPSSDINNDGIVEIPTQEILPGAKTYQSDNDKTGLLYLTRWIQVLKDGNSIEIMKSVINYADGYMLVLPKEFAERLTIFSYSKNSRWDVCLYKSSDNSIGEKLFTVIKLTQQDWAENPLKYDGYIKILDDSQYIIAAQIADAGSANGINNDFIKQNIVLYKNGEN